MTLLKTNTSHMTKNYQPKLKNQLPGQYCGKNVANDLNMFHITARDAAPSLHSAWCRPRYKSYVPQKTLSCSPGQLNCCFLSSADVSEPKHHHWHPRWHHRVEFKNSRSSALFLSRCLSFFDFFTFIFIFFPEIMLYLPFFRSFKYLEICTGPEFSSPFAFLSFFRLCRFSFFPFFLCCFSFFLFLDCFLDLLRESLLRLRLDECEEPDEEEEDEDELEEDDEDDEDELEEDEEEDLLRLRFRFFFSRPLLLDLLLSSVLEEELDTLDSAFVDMAAAEYS